MVKTKARTLKRVSKSSKKTYFLKGGNQLEYIDLYNSYSKNLKDKKELYDKIKSEGTYIYDSITTQKNDSFRSSANEIISYLESFYQTCQDSVEQKKTTLQQNLTQYPTKYNQYFIETNVELNILINEINDTLNYARNINSMFQNKEIHVHLIQYYYNMLSEIKFSVNSFNERLQNLLSNVDKIYNTVKKQPEENPIDEDLETYKRNIQESISIVNRPIPDGFIPDSNTQFIKGCPLGTVLQNDQCVYLSGSNAIETVPFQSNLIKPSEYVVWFNQINQQSVGIPTVFKKKPIEYVLPLSESDAKLYKSKYVVAEQNGNIKLDRNNMKKFVNELTCCWNQELGTMTNTANEMFYMDYDNLPQPVIVLDKASPIIHKDISFIKYVKLLNEEDQILSGIQYVETDISGNINDTIKPFYPKLSGFTKEDNSFKKKAYNDVDTFQYVLLDVPLNNISNLNTPNLNTETVYDTSLINHFKSNMIPTLHINKYVKINADSYISPFILPSFLMKEGDYFLIHNISTNYPIVFNISKDSNPKHLVLYPNEIYCLIFSNSSKILQYGFIKYNLIETLYSKTNKVAKIMPLNKYVFVESNDIYEGDTFIVNGITPVLDSHKNAIVVPNFDETKKIYYDYDDVFQIEPLEVQIVNPEVKVINNKTYNSLEYPQLKESKEFHPYTSQFITKTSVGLIVYCDESGIPYIDMLGYFIPVITPVFYNNINYFWLNYEKASNVEFKQPYSDVSLFDSNVLIQKQFTTNYYSTYNQLAIYTNKDSIPAIYEPNKFIVAENTSNLQKTTLDVPINQSFSTQTLNIQNLQDELDKAYVSNLIETYIENTTLLINKFSDISGNMNNFNNLKTQLQYNSQIGTLKSLEEAQKIYNEVLSTYNKLNKFLQDEEFKKLNESQVKTIKNVRKNELEVIQTSINNLQKTIDSLEINSDSQILKDTLQKIIFTHDSLSKNIENLQDYNMLQAQEKNTSILMKSVTILQSNVDSYIEELEKNKNSLNTLVLQEKEKYLSQLQNNVQLLIDSIKELESRKTDLSESNRNTFELYFSNLQNIEESITKDKMTLINSVESIDERLSNYELYIQNLNNLKNSIQTLLSTNETISSERIQEAKGIVLEKINKYKILHNSIVSLLNSLNLSNQDSYENQLNNYNIEVLTIETELTEENDLTMLQGKNSRIDEIVELERSLQTELQTLQLTPPPQQSGGKKRWQTRKHKVNRH